MYWPVAFKDIFIFSSGGLVVTGYGRGHHEERFCKITLNLSYWLRICHLKTFLI